MTYVFGLLFLTRRLHAALLAMWLLEATAFGQQAPQFGKVTGTVRDARGQVLAGVVITLAGPERNNLVTVSTSLDGTYLLSSVRYGQYTLTAKLRGFQPSNGQTLTFASQAAIIDFSLTPLSEVRAVSRPTGGDGANTTKTAPSFRSAGMQGDAAPTGYASGVSAEETSQVMDRMVGLSQTTFSIFASNDSILGCDRKDDLVQAARADPTDFEANHTLGAFYLQHGDPAKSIPYLDLAAKLDPANLDNSRHLALAYLTTAQYSDAIRLLEHAIEQDDRNPASYELLAASFAAVGKSQEAITEYKLACKLDSREENLFSSGIALIRLGAPDEASKILDAGIGVHPRFGETLAGERNHPGSPTPGQ